MACGEIIAMIQGFMKKNSLVLLLLCGSGVLYLLLRIPHLTLQPIFADEAIYIRWSQVMRSEPTLRFLPLTDGKTPLFMWAMMPMFKIFHDPLMAGRMLSVFSGFLTWLGVVFLGWKFFNRRVALLSAFLTAIVPFMVFFDRMALVDSMLAAFSIWSLILALSLARYVRLDLAMLLGYTLGGGILTKTPGMFQFFTVPFAILIFPWNRRKKEPYLLVKLLFLWLVAFGIGMAMYNILRLGPEFSQLSSRNQDYIFSPLEILRHPLDPFIPHVGDVNEFFIRLLTIPGYILLIGSAVWTLVKRNRTVFVLWVWAMVPMLAEMVFNKVFTARYILSSIPIFLILIGWFVDSFVDFLKTQKIQLATPLVLAAFVVVLAVQPMVTDYHLLTNPSLAWLPHGERKGYLEDWTAGYGFPEIATFLKQQAQNQIVVVGTEGYFGTLPDGLQIYLDKEKNVLVQADNATISAGLRKAALDHPTYYVANKSQYFYPGPNVELIKEFPKATSSDSKDAILFYQIHPLPKR